MALVRALDLLQLTINQLALEKAAGLGELCRARELFLSEVFEDADWRMEHYFHTFARGFAKNR
jgi:hypothetical protein